MKLTDGNFDLLSNWFFALGLVTGFDDFEHSVNFNFFSGYVLMLSGLNREVLGTLWTDDGMYSTSYLFWQLFLLIHFVMTLSSVSQLAFQIPVWYLYGWFRNFSF